jgi:chymotrypsin
VLALLSSVVLAQVPKPLDFNWRDLKDIWRHPRLQPAVQNIQSRFGITARTNPLQRIVGGEAAFVGQFPFHVLTVIDNMWWCGGSLLNANWALTAAHCIYLSQHAQLYSIVDLDVGYYFTSGSAQLIVHEEYDDYNIFNDVGCIRLATPAPNNLFTSYISLPRDHEEGEMFAGALANIQGFGVYSDAVGTVSEFKRYVNQTIMENANCLWQPYPNELCTETYGGRGPCNGDSGGGLFIGDPNIHSPARFVVGIVSYGALAGCELSYPAAFARVTHHMPWIDRHIAV